MTCLYPDLGSASDWLKENSKPSDRLKENFNQALPTSQGFKWQPHETSAVFSGYISLGIAMFPVTSSIDINVPTKALLAAKTKSFFVLMVGTSEKQKECL